MSKIVDINVRKNTGAVNSPLGGGQDLPTTGDDLNVFTVNTNRPLTGNNYHTIQAAVDAAEAEIDATPITGTAQAGTLVDITLAADDIASNNYYNGATISITSGTGSGQSALITAYNGTTKVATAAWATAPDNTSVYEITGLANFIIRKTILLSDGVYEGNVTVQRHLDFASNTPKYLMNPSTSSTVISGLVTINSSCSFTGIAFKRGSANNCIVAGLTDARDSSLATNIYSNFKDCIIVGDGAVNYSVDYSAIDEIQRAIFDNTLFSGGETTFALRVTGAHQVIIRNSLSSTGEILLDNPGTNILQIIDSSWTGRIQTTGVPVAFGSNAHFILNRVNWSATSNNPFRIVDTTCLRIVGYLYVGGNWGGSPVITSGGGATFSTLQWVPGTFYLAFGLGNQINSLGKMVAAPITAYLLVL